MRAVERNETAIVESNTTTSNVITSAEASSAFFGR
jgi:hypothetical protein